MRFLCLAAVAALSVLAPSAAFGQNLSITNYQYVSEQRLTLTTSDVVYRADLVNTGGQLASVSATFTSLDTSSVQVEPGKDTLQFAPVPANSQTTSSNTFTIRVNRTVPFDFNKLQWTFKTNQIPPPVANAGPNQAVTVGATVVLNGSGSTSGSGNPLTYAWTLTARPAGSTAALAGANTVSPTFAADKAGTYMAQLIVNDGLASSAPSTVTISTSCVKPVANAGQAQMVNVNSLVQLNGAGSTDACGLPLTYQWSLIARPAGSAAALNNPTAVNPTFTADVPGTYMAQLIVNNGTLSSDAATVMITTNPVVPPTANAGPNQTVNVGSTVQLNGSGSTNPSGIGTLTYSWAFMSRPAGSTSILTNPSSVMPAFVPDVAGNFVITLTVNNGQASSSASVTVSTTQPPAPVANAGPNQTVTVGSTVVLNGSASTSGSGKPLTYAWTLTRPAGSTAALTGANTVSPSFVLDKAGTYMAQLIVNDGLASSAPSTVTISTSLVKPVANAGPAQIVNIGVVVQLNGAGSTDANGLSLTYQWSLITLPPSSAAVLNNSTAVNPAFTADRPGSYVAQLIVNNGTLASDPVTVMITTQPPLAPTANAGPPQTVNVGSTVALNGSGTDPQNLPITFQWSLINKPVGSAASLSSTVVPNPAFIADVAGTYIAQLMVNNGFQSSVASTVTIGTTCSQPVANPGPNQSVQVGSTVTLNGSGSGDVCHDPLTYAWSFTARPAGSTATLSGATTVAPAFVADMTGTYVVQLIVNNGFTKSNPITVSITSAPDIILPANVTVQPDQQMNFPVTLANPAPAGGVFLSFVSSDPSKVTVLPANVFIPQGGTGSSQPKVTGVNVGSAIITASASGLQPASQVVQVTPGQTLSFQPGSLTFTNSAIQFLTLNLPAPAQADLKIDLSSSNPAAATVPATVTFLAGTVAISVPVTPVGSGSTVIHASALPNIADTTATVTIPGPLSIGVPASTTVALGQSGTFAVTLSQAAPAGGVTVALGSSDSSKVTVPASVFIAAGATTPATAAAGDRSGYRIGDCHDFGDGIHIR